MENNSPIASLNIQIASLSSTDNQLLNSLDLKFDSNPSFVLHSQGQKSLQALDQSKDLSSAEAQLHPPTNPSSVQMEISQSQDTLGIHFNLQNKYIGSKVVSIPLTKLENFNSFEDTIPCKIEVETVDGNLEVIDVKFNIFWQSKMRTSGLVQDVEQFNFQEYQNQQVSEKIQAKREEIELEKTLSAKKTQSQSTANLLGKSKKPNHKISHRSKESSPSKKYEKFQPTKRTIKPNHRRTRTMTSRNGHKSSKSQLQSTSMLKQSLSRNGTRSNLMKKKPKTARIAQMERNQKLEQEKKNKKAAKQYVNKTVDKFQDTIDSSSLQILQKGEQLIEYNRIVNTPAHLLMDDQLSLAQIKQNMELLNGDLSLTDMEYALDAETLSRRYNPDSSHPSPIKSSHSRTPTKYGSKMASKVVNEPVNHIKPLQSVQQAQNDYLKRVVCHLDSKLQNYNILENQLEMMKQNQARSDQQREEMRISVVESTKSMKIENSKLRAIIEENLLEKRKIDQERASTVEENQLLQQKVTNLEIKNHDYEHKLAELKIQVQSGNIYSEELRKAKSELSSMQKASFTETSSLIDAIEQMKANLNKFADEKKQLSKEITNLTNSASVLKSQLTQEKNNNRELRQELDIVNTQLQSQKVDLHVQSVLAAYKNQNRELLEQTETNNENCLNQMKQLENHLLSKSRQNNEVMDTNQQEITDLQKEIQQKNSEISKLMTANSTLKNSGIQLREHVVSLENLISIKKDVFQQYQNSQEIISELEKSNNLKNQKIDELELLVDTDAKRTLKLSKNLDSLTETVQSKNEVSFHSIFKPPFLPENSTFQI